MAEQREKRFYPTAWKEVESPLKSSGIFQRFTHPTGAK
jgi:hypothetical protein